MVKTVFLDLDDTILDFTRAEEQAILGALEECGLPGPKEVAHRYHEINKHHWELLEQGVITRAQVKSLRFAQLFRELGVEQDIETFCSVYERHLSQGAFFIPGAEALLKALEGKYGLYIASNGGTAVQNRRLDKSGIRGYFQGIFVSEAMGANKPSPAFYEKCFAAIPGFSRETTVMVGDSLTSDIRGGRDAGLTTVWFNPAGKPGREDIVPHHVIRSLDELPALLENL